MTGLLPRAALLCLLLSGALCGPGGGAHDEALHAVLALAAPPATLPHAQHQEACPLLRLSGDAGCPPGFVGDQHSRTECSPCEKGHFTVDGAQRTCQPYLGCDELARDVTRLGSLATGGVKRLYRARWQGRDVVLAEGHQKEDFAHGVRMLLGLSPHPRIIQPFGFCLDRHQTLLPYYRRGNANELDAMLEADQESLSRLEVVQIRLRLSLQFVQAIEYLHNSPLGIRVMCDAESVSKLLTQFVVTEEYELLLVDVDAAPEVVHSEDEAERTLVKCGHRQFHRSYFTPPEQLWPFPDRPYNDDEMPPYDEKVDIYKIPDVLARLLGKLSVMPACMTQPLEHALMVLKAQCKHTDPTRRPTATEVVRLYQKFLVKATLGCCTIDF